MEWSTTTTTTAAYIKYKDRLIYFVVFRCQMVNYYYERKYFNRNEILTNKQKKTSSKEAQIFRFQNLKCKILIHDINDDDDDDYGMKMAK